MLLYLDFDGVRHPDEVYIVKGKIVLKAEGELFMWANRLVEALANRSDVQIVLSTSWVREVGFLKAKAALPETILERVIGSTFHTRMASGWHSDSSDNWRGKTRYQQITSDLRRRATGQKWVAIDDDMEGWASSARGNLVQTDPAQGLGDEATFARLVALLEVHR
ncbi:HAD domain-containing protein [Pseudomonas sp. SA3-5]|uniref:HAD domain-containing protein n=1 Tax=Pseudomonas aestuarii TaxID=3018340 RepID=A0ABT4XHL9_9PSED|nr:HAD domain-containing protein [Pseudomonas aestuarii]MDA7087672.1 HAD domain-containing protein [Pseudomonas aestuarii]